MEDWTGLKNSQIDTSNNRQSSGESAESTELAELRRMTQVTIDNPRVNPLKVRKLPSCDE